MHGSQVVLGRFRIDERIRPERDATTFHGVDLSTGCPLLVCVVEADVATASRGRRSKHHPALLPILELARLTDSVPPLPDLPPSADALVLLDAPAGQPLDERLARRGSLTLSEALRLMLPIVDALARLHDEGLVHGSVHPAAIEISEGGERARLSLVGMGDHHLAYRSPPRLTNGSPSSYDDTWAVLCCLYEAVTGSPPYEAESPQALARRIFGGKPLPLRATSLAHTDLQKLFDRIFSRSSQQRFHKASALRDELEALSLRHSAALAPAPPEATAPAANRSALGASTRSRTAAWGDKRALLEGQAPSSSHATLAVASSTSTAPEMGRRTMAPTFGRQERDTDLGTGPLKTLPDVDANEGKRSAITAQGYLSQENREEVLRAASDKQKAPAKAAHTWQDEPTANQQQRQVELAASFEASVATEPEPAEARVAILPQHAAHIDFDQWFGAPEAEPDPVSSRPTLPGLEQTLEQLHDVNNRPTLVDPIERAAHPEARPPQRDDPQEEVPPPAPAPEEKQTRPVKPLAETMVSAKEPRESAPSESAPSESAPPAPPPHPRSLFEGRTIAAFLAGVLLTAIAALALVHALEAPTTPAPTAAPPPAPKALISANSAPSLEAVSPQAPAATSAPLEAAPPSSALARGEALTPITCLRRAFPEGTFSDKAEGDFLCSDSNARRGAGKLRTLIVEGGRSQSKLTDAMRAWSKLGWYELPAYAALREQCCPQPITTELPKTSCAALDDAILDLGKATSPETLDEPVKRFGRAVSCVLEFHQESFYGQSGHIAPASEETFRALLKQARF